MLDLASKEQLPLAYNMRLIHTMFNCRLFALGVTMYGQMTAGSYCYIGPQVDIPVRTYRTVYHVQTDEGLFGLLLRQKFTNGRMDVRNWFSYQ